MSIKLTKKQTLVYNYIADFIKNNDGRSPSYRDICAGIGLSSVSAVAEHVDNLVKIGALRKIPGEARSLEVIDFTYPETTNLFRQAMSAASEEDVETLRRAAEILGLNLSNNTQGDS